jgi:hypothetical protein
MSEDGTMARMSASLVLATARRTLSSLIMAFGLNPVRAAAWAQLAGWRRLQSPSCDLIRRLRLWGVDAAVVDYARDAIAPGATHETTIPKEGLTNYLVPTTERVPIVGAIKWWM